MRRYVIASVLLVSGCGAVSITPPDQTVSTPLATRSHYPAISTEPTIAPTREPTRHASVVTGRVRRRHIVTPSPSVYYANCTAAREAGVTPIHRGEPGYRSGLDRDSDGVACE